MIHNAVMNNINFVFTFIFSLRIGSSKKHKYRTFRITASPIFSFHFLRQLHWGGAVGAEGQEEEVQTDTMGKRGLLLPDSSGTLGPCSHPLTHFSPGRSKGWNNLGLKIRRVEDCPILSEPSLASGSLCSAQPLCAVYQDRHPHQGDVCGCSCLVLGFS